MQVGLNKSLRLLMLLLLLVQSSMAVEAPDELTDWRSWVLWRDDVRACPFISTDSSQRPCAWPGSLKLSVGERQLSFSQNWQVYAGSEVYLPGDKGHWPQQVKVDGSSALLLEQDQRPLLRLKAGVYNITGLIKYPRIPPSIALPKAIGSVELRLLGKDVSQIAFDKLGRLILGDQGASVEVTQANGLNLQVFRKLSDGYPLQLQTQLQIDVSGVERKAKLGQFLLPGFVPLNLSSELPARIHSDGDLEIQLRPGRWIVNMSARYSGLKHSFSFNRQSEFWPQQELWAFAPKPEYRAVSIVGVSAIDPSQTALPRQWQHLSSYLLEVEQSLNIQERFRGQVKKSAHQLALRRDLWLSFDGASLLSKEQLSGKVMHNDRLTSQLGYQVGSAEINGNAQLITQLADSKGVAIRPGPLALTSVGLVDPESLQVNAWQQDVDNAELVLHLAPGYRLFHVSGADAVSNAYLSSWNLWEIFVSILLIVLLWRLFSWRAGLLALCYVLLIHGVSGAPATMSLLLLAALYFMHNLLPVGSFKRLVQLSYFLWLIVLGFNFLGFAVDQARLCLYPQLELSHKSIEPELKQDPMPLTQAAPMQEMDLAQADSFASRLGSGKVRQPKKPDYYQAYSADSAVQTGPGVPSWRGNISRLAWAGPVAQSQQIQLWIMPPWLNRSLNILRIFGFLAVLSFLLPTKIQTSALKPILPLLLLALVLPTVPVEAQLPDQQLLKQYKQRLLAPPTCMPNCLSIRNGVISADENRISIRFLVSSAAHVAMPLPIDKALTGSTTVTLDGKLANTNMLQQQYYLPVPKGNHRVELLIDVRDINVLDLQFQLLPHNLSFSSDVWQLNGLRDGALVKQSLKFTRQNRQREKRDSLLLTADAAPAFVRVVRHFNFDLDWRINTTVQRIAPQQGAINVSVKLLPGESVLSKEMPVSDNQVLVALAANQRSVHWQSLLAQQSPLTLQAPSNDNQVHHWLASPSLKWQLEYAGLNPIRQQGQGDLQWWPQQGESLQLTLDKPNAATGNNLTIDSLNLKQSPGQRKSETTLQMKIRSSQGQEYNLALPAGAEVDRLRINQREVLFMQQQQSIKLALQPGINQIELSWFNNQGFSFKTTTPALSISDAANISIDLSMPQQRWVLLVGGPRMGPAILFWGGLLVLLIASLVLGAQSWSPLRHWQWFLLGSIVSLSYMPLLLLILLWFIALSFRQRLLGLPMWQKMGVKGYNLLQVLLAIATVAMLMSLLASVANGLLYSQPDMQIVGNESRPGFLRWYQDQSRDALPSAWVISIPMMVYRLLVLLWSVWLSFALISWLKWGWQQFSEGGLWRKSETQNSEKETPEA